MQVAPGLFALVDLPDLQGLLAPKPLLLDVGLYDTCFLADTAVPTGLLVQVMDACRQGGAERVLVGTKGATP